MRYWVMVRKAAVLAGVFTLGYYKGVNHTLTHTDELELRRMRKEALLTQARRSKKRKGG